MCVMTTCPMLDGAAPWRHKDPMSVGHSSTFVFESSATVEVTLGV